MKSHFLPALAAAGMMALGACSSSTVIDDDLHSPANRIGFDTSVSRNSRAVSNSNFRTFFVYGTYTVPTQSSPITVFTGDAVTKSDAGVWSYSGERFWVPEGSYDFYAYSCENEAVKENVSGTSALNGRVFNLNGFHSNATHQHDLLFAKETGVSRASRPGQTSPAVALQFRHLLTRVVFSFRSQFPEGHTVTVSNPRLENFRDRGDFRGATETWENVDRSGTDVRMNLTLSPSTADITSATATTAAVYMVPFAYAQANVRLIFDVNVTKGSTKLLGRTITATWQPDWKGGHSLNNVITVTGGSSGLDPIRFSATIAGGDDGSDWTSENGNLHGIHFEAN